MKVSKHAIERHRERAGSNKSDEEITRVILKMLRNGKETSFTRKADAVQNLMNHNYQPVKYYDVGGGKILVVSEEDDTVITEEFNLHGRWVTK